MSSESWQTRLAREEDIPVLEKLIEASVRQLLPEHYSAEVLEASLGPAFGVDRQLIRDGTYFVIEDHGTIVSCGGWSRRETLYGGDHHRSPDQPLLDPKRDSARIRAFFVHPGWVRRGLGRAMLAASEAAARAAGFQRVVLVGTLAGEKLYAAHGYTVEERYDAKLGEGLLLPVVRMSKAL
jgi:N-acetylglutamate synthase-like GNAT family acetyltransferase